MLVGVVYIYLSVGSTSYEALFVIKNSPYNQKWLWLALFASFAAKMQIMFPIHFNLGGMYSNSHDGKCLESYLFDYITRC